MADPQLDRMPAARPAPAAAREPSASSSSTASRRALTPSVLSLRLLASPGTDPQPALQLATDLLQAAGGSLHTVGDNVLAAAFPNLSLAVLIARRLQWALQGLEESGAHPAAILSVSAASEGVEPPAAAPGDILLSPAAAAAVGSLPGFDLRPIAAGWQQFLYATAQPVSPADDEQAVLRLIRDSGREDPFPQRRAAAPPTRPLTERLVTERSVTERPAPITPGPAPSGDFGAGLGRGAQPRAAQTSSRQVSSGQAGSAAAPLLGAPARTAATPSDPAPGSLLEKLGPAPRRWYILAGCAVLLCLVVAGLFAFRHNGATPAAQQSSPVTPILSPSIATPAPPSPSSAKSNHAGRKQSPSGAPGISAATSSGSTAAAGSSDVPALSPASGRGNSAGPNSLAGSAASGSASAAGARVSPPSRAAVATGKGSKALEGPPCDLNDAGVLRTLDRAESAMHRGELEEARSAFLSLRGCPAAHPRVEDDLRKVQQKIDALR